MSRKSAYNNQVDDAIVKALGKAREPLRYNELHREANRIFEQRIWIKTFNDHLKKLCEKSVVVRKEKSRYHVTYELEEKHLGDYTRDRYDQLRMDARAFRELADLRRQAEDIRVIKENLPLLLEAVELLKKKEIEKQKKEMEK